MAQLNPNSMTDMSKFPTKPWLLDVSRVVFNIEGKGLNKVHKMSKPQSFFKTGILVKGREYKNRLKGQATELSACFAIICYNH